MIDDMPPLPEPYGQITTHTITGQQFFYRWPELPYLDNAKDCVTVYTADQMRAYGDARAAAATERAAQVCDEHASIEGIAQKCAAAIRAGS